MAFSPRKRAKSNPPTIKYWPKVDLDTPKLLGFAGYKAGMTGIIYKDNNKNSIFFGQEVYSAVTIVETPPLFVLGVVTYGISLEKNAICGLKTIFAKKLPPEFKRHSPSMVKGHDESDQTELKSKIDEIKVIRLLMSTQPHLSGISKKKPDIFEIEIGGSTIKDRLDYSLSLLGKTINIDDVYQPGDQLDIIAVTKGKGYQGPVKRWVIKLLRRKARKTKRKAASLGPWFPHAVMYTVPLSGQMGYHKRTVRNIKLLDIKQAPDDTNFSLHKYGLIKSNYLVLKGSIPGPSKRLIKFRHVSRPVNKIVDNPEISYIKGVM